MGCLGTLKLSEGQQRAGGPEVRPAYWYSPVEGFERTEANGGVGLATGRAESVLMRSGLSTTLESEAIATGSYHRDGVGDLFGGRAVLNPVKPSIATTSSPRRQVSSCRRARS